MIMYWDFMHNVNSDIAKVIFLNRNILKGGSGKSSVLLVCLQILYCV